MRTPATAIVAGVADDDLSDFERARFSHDGKERLIFRKGSGPAVIVIAEMPGITPKVAAFARKVADIGCTAVMPHLFGEPGKDPVAGGTLDTTKYLVSSIAPACVSREFVVWATNRTSPVIDWLRALAVVEHGRCGGPGVGAIGMCFTGGFALAMATDPSVVAPVLSQPSLPFVMTKSQRHAIDCSRSDLATVKSRCETQGLSVLGLRFKGDRLSPPDRFRFLREELGDAFVAIELDDSSANPDARIKPHSVVTEHLIDEPGQPTRQALDQVLDLFRRKLHIA
jgi:dienelactone hydrolase